MPYLFVWLYLIKCVVHTQSYVDQTQKDFLVFLVVFGKCFILKNFKKSKKFYNSIFGNSLGSHASRKALNASLLRSSRNSLASESPSHENNLENFSKFLGFCHFRDLVASGSSNHELTQKVSQLSRESICLSRKWLRQNFQNSIHGILATHFADLLVGQLSHENRVFCTNKVKSQIVFKNFSVFPCTTCTHLVLFSSPSSKTSIVTHKTFIFFINPSSIFKKMYAFSLIFNVYQVSNPSFLGFCVYVEIWRYGCWIWFCWCFAEFDIWFLLVLLV